MRVAAAAAAETFCSIATRNLLLCVATCVTRPNYMYLFMCRKREKDRPNRATNIHTIILSPSPFSYTVPYRCTTYKFHTFAVLAAAACLYHIIISPLSRCLSFFHISTHIRFLPTHYLLFRSPPSPPVRHPRSYSFSLLTHTHTLFSLFALIFLTNFLNPFPLPAVVVCVYCYCYTLSGWVVGDGKQGNREHHRAKRERERE